ncbi:MAG: hypothetical protein ACPGVD_03040 [Flavobacteriales bacterium]
MDFNLKYSSRAIFFIAIFLMNILLPSIIYFNFVVNQEYIASNLCIEKDIEESTCNGHCELKKSLAKVEKSVPQDKDFTTNVKSHITELFSPNKTAFNSIDKFIINNYLIYSNSETNQGVLNSLFRPPIL